MNDLTAPAIVTIALLILVWKHWRSSVLETVSISVVVLCAIYLIPISPSYEQNLFVSPPAKLITETQCFKNNLLIKIIETTR